MQWFEINRMSPTFVKLSSACYSAAKYVPECKLQINGHEIQNTDKVSFLGVAINVKLSFDTHVSTVCIKVSARLSVIIRFKRILDIPEKRSIPKTFILPYYRYCAIIYKFCSFKMLRIWNPC